MRVLADENFPRPALEVLRKSGWDVVSIAEDCPGVSDEDVAGICADQMRILFREVGCDAEQDYPAARG